MADTFIDIVARITFGDALLTLWPLLPFMAGIIVYFLIAFYFYEFLSRKDPFNIVEDPRKPHEHFLHGLEYFFLFPVITFAWFFLLAVTISIPAQSGVRWFLYDVGVDRIFFIAVAITMAMRVSAYVNQKISREIARLVPLNFISILVIELPNVPLDAPVKIAQVIPTFAHELVYYFVFIMITELVLKQVYEFQARRSYEKDEQHVVSDELDTLKMEMEASKTPLQKRQELFKPLEQEKKYKSLAEDKERSDEYEGKKDDDE